MVERQLPKLYVVGSSPITRSIQVPSHDDKKAVGLDGLSGVGFVETEANLTPFYCLGEVA